MEKCKGTTATGKPCRITVAENREYCRYHSTDQTKHQVDIDSKPLSKDYIYREAFECLRRFGDMAVAVRHATYVQGYIVLSATVFLWTKAQYVYAAAAALFCVLFTITLFGLHRHYVFYYFDSREYIRILENEYGIPASQSYVVLVEDKRKNRVRETRFGWLNVYSTFLLIAVSATAVFLSAIYKLYC